ncbi:MAG TPA: CPBP family intramembrane glutamic endopeptidase [Pyrinomonadaceae bacterium]|nr:CPBP family intramembrane glutamic endopeptidase [Pyrinomonadaceae bacterium]
MIEQSKAGAEFAVEEAEGVERIALWEIASVVTSCLLAEWVVLSFAGGSKLVGAAPVVLALGFMLYSHRERGETAKDVGFRLDNFFAACRLLLLPTATVIVLVIAVAWFTRHSLVIAPWRNRFLLLPLWALFQQYALNGFINRRAQLALGKGMKSVLVVALIFSLLHFPNLLLAVLTFVGGLIWAAVYQRQPNLFALALSHSVSSFALALTVSPTLLNSLRVGFKYFG